MQDAYFPSDIIAGIDDWVTAIQHSPVGQTTTSAGSASPSSEELLSQRKELKRELTQARTQLERERQRRDIAEAETAALRETLLKHVPSKEERDQLDAQR